MSAIYSIYNSQFPHSKLYNFTSNRLSNSSVETASDQEICNHVDQISFSNKIQLKFWERVSILCKKSKDQAYGQYYRYKQQSFTDKSNNEDKTAISIALKQVLTEIGYQVQTSSDQAICILVDLMIRKQYKFWDRVSLLCKQSKLKAKYLYLQYKKYLYSLFTDTLNDNDRIVIDKYIGQNQIFNIKETIKQIVNTYFKDRSISTSDIKKIYRKTM
ncbi:Hypothetical_protein [Hexamita inflata]|uniref:Hypothetical_protein n=1 Tax=Hexamita inflata TaxID=28002 RepID=A0AA86R0T1_9EUKA|nr:Hypothetical protein HINF_LOCUS55805 [Hexamita inflata]